MSHRRTSPVLDTFIGHRGPAGDDRGSAPVRSAAGASDGASNTEDVTPTGCTSSSGNFALYDSYTQRPPGDESPDSVDFAALNDSSRPASLALSETLKVTAAWRPRRRRSIAEIHAAAAAAAAAPWIDHDLAERGRLIAIEMGLCPRCLGNGRHAHFDWAPCRDCGGTGGR